MENPLTTFDIDSVNQSINRDSRSVINFSLLGDSIDLNAIAIEINNIIKKCLGGYGDCWFAEFSILSSIIDPSIGSLSSISIVNGDQEFKNKVEKFVTPIISSLYDLHADDWWFNNPETFILPSKPAVYFAKSNPKDLDSNILESIAFKSNEQLTCYKEVQAGSGVFVSIMQYPRTFLDIMKESRKIFERYRSNADLELHYHNGASLVKTYYDKFLAEDKSEYCYLTFPIVASRAINVMPRLYIDSFGDIALKKRLQGQGNFFIYFKCSSLTAQAIENLYNEINTTIHWLTLNYTFNTGYLLQEAARNEAIKSAKAAIMSRNMSHNLGSHVMFYIKQKLQSVGKIVNDGILEDLFSKDGKLDSSKLKLQDNTIHEETEMPFLVGLGRFINYLQERQDYIATIATDYIPARSTISFKDFIYDELKPDLRYKRHKKIDLDGNKKDMVSGEEPRNLLLDYIAYSEKYEGSDSIVINFGEFDGTKASSTSAGEDDFDKLRKFNIALPGGVIGRQAFFSIIENIIRNAAKHSLKAANIVLDFEVVDVAELRTRTLEYIVPKGQKGYTGAAKAALSSADLIELYEKNSNDYSILRITSNMQNEEESINKLVKKLSSDYVDEQGSMDETAKGLKEIRISAAWMRGYSVDLDIPINKEPPAVTIAKTIKENTDKYKIEYYICLPKPKNFAFVVKEEPKSVVNPEIHGCKIYTLDKISSLTKAFTDEIANYDVVVFCCDGAEDMLKQYISPRYISYVEDNINMLEIFNNHEAEILDALQESVYSKWFKQKICQDDIRISILDDKAYNKNKSKSSDSEPKQEKAEVDNGVNLSTTGSATDDCYDNTVLFTTHYEGRASKNPMLNGNSSYNNVLFAEGITGNNSTDRLIRQNEWNAEWRYKHLAAGLLRVAIFDERIFSYVAAAAESNIDSAINDLVTSCNGVSGYDSICDLVEIKFHKINDVATIEKIANILEANEPTAKDSIKVIIEDFIQGEKQPYDCYKSQQLHEKRINVYDVYCKDDASGRYIEFVGYNAPIDDHVAKYDPNSNIAVLATLRKDNGGYVVRFEADGLMQNKFDLISIHQGILDKIYEHFSIKGDETAMKIITDKLIAEFARQAEGSRLSIHSGRSRPNKSDMPQHVPFVQFAAIDHAVRDCKYTLSELLLTSHYEMRKEDLNK